MAGWPAGDYGWSAAGPARAALGQVSNPAAQGAAEPCRLVPGRCQPRLARNSAIAAYWHAAAAQTQA
jgi:hypothetical protein